MASKWWCVWFVLLCCGAVGSVAKAHRVESDSDSSSELEETVAATQADVETSQDETSSVSESAESNSDAATSESQESESEEAKEKRGNLVEYFGREKANAIREGRLVHIFREGKILDRARTFRGANFGLPIDDVFARFLFRLPTGVESETAFDIDHRGTPVTWEGIEANDENLFDDQRLRSSELYLTYTAESEERVLFDGSGHTRLLVDGMPHEGDHYDFGWQLIPLHLAPGKHDFVLYHGRFPRMRARLVAPHAPVQFTTRDLTLPNIRREEADEELVGAIRLINMTSTPLAGLRISCRNGDRAKETAVPLVAPLSVRKVPFYLPGVTELDDETDRVGFDLQLIRNGDDEVLATETVELQVRSKYRHHSRTFISEIDGSVQYFSVAPAPADHDKPLSLYLTVHGASVEATNQAAAYQQKETGHIVAPTNRRPFGFAWEDWGRLDALEVLEEAERVYQTDADRTYLTGHSMGGHGTWYLGATYPDRFAAIAPCAGYPDLLGYRDLFISRWQEEMNREEGGPRRDAAIRRMETLANEVTVFDDIFERAGNATRTLKLITNYAQLGVYVLHGEKDTVVPTILARDMRRRLGEFHSDFTYYEYPNGTHWYGNHSVDWKPLFDFLDGRTKRPASELNELTFSTASPGVSASCRGLTIVQQERPWKISTVRFARSEDQIDVTTDNVAVVAIDTKRIGVGENGKLTIDQQQVNGADASSLRYYRYQGDNWELLEMAPPTSEKGPHRSGGLKDAFRHRFVLVYGTGGTDEENAWYLNRARYDAETFWYRGNGNVEVVADAAFTPAQYADQNVILYGNRDNNSAWSQLLSECPLQVSKGEMALGDSHLYGQGWGAYFIYRRPDSEIASVGVVTATGAAGMRAAYANHYLVNGSSFPDVMIFDQDLLTDGIRAVKCAGFWGNRWDYESGDFVWR